MSNEGPSSTELVPRAWQPDDLTVMTGTLADIEAKVLDYRRYIETHQVTDTASCAEMKQKIVDLKGLRNDADNAANPIKSVITKCSQWVQTKYLKAYNAAEQAKGMADAKVGDWEQAEERRTALEKAQEQERLERQREEEAAAQLKKDREEAAAAKKARIAELNALLKEKKILKRDYTRLLVEAGAIEEANVARAEADAEEHVATTPEVKVQSKKPHVSGTVGRKNYSAKCLDRRVFIEQFMVRVVGKHTEEVVRLTREDGTIDEIEVDWWDYINVSDEALSKTAREMKNVEVMEKTFHGIKAEEKRTY